MGQPSVEVVDVVDVQRRRHDGIRQHVAFKTNRNLIGFSTSFSFFQIQPFQQDAIFFVIIPNVVAVVFSPSFGIVGVGHQFGFKIHDVDRDQCIGADGNVFVGGYFGIFVVHFCKRHWVRSSLRVRCTQCIVITVPRCVSSAPRIQRMPSLVHVVNDRNRVVGATRDIHDIRTSRPTLRGGSTPLGMPLGTTIGTTIAAVAAKKVL